MHWLGGCGPLEVARKINQSLPAVERYLLIERFYPPSTHPRPGQTPWVTVDKDEKASYGTA